MSGNEGYSTVEDWDDDTRIDNKAACDIAIGNQLFARAKCRTWASKTKNVCTTLRRRLMALPAGAAVGAEEELRPTAGHQSLKSAKVALADMTKYFHKLDSCCTKIKTLRGYRFLAKNYDDLTAEQKEADQTKKNEIHSILCNF